MTARPIFSYCLILCFGIVLPDLSAEEDGTFKVESNLRAGVGKASITPSEVKEPQIAGHTRTVNGVRDQIRAAVLILDDGNTKAAIVSLDAEYSPLVPEAEAVLYRELDALADRIIGVVFSSYSKHTADKEKREAEEKERENQ